MDRYVGVVDDLRLWLNDRLGAILGTQSAG